MQEEKTCKKKHWQPFYKTLPKGFGQEPPSAGPHAHDEKPDEKKSTPKDDSKEEQLQKELANAKASKDEAVKREREQHEKELEQMKIKLWMMHENRQKKRHR